MFPKETTENTKPSKASSSSTITTTSWSKFKDPRIVRVSRAFGGKDRHSKVCTVRGLRDRRVRLSVPTAIQLYDLQDRLGLNQPSKVVDWLLNAAKHEIDELPPLQIPQGLTFSQSYDPIRGFRVNSEPDKQGLGICLGKSRDVSGETSHDHRDVNWARSHEQEEMRQFNNLEHNPTFLLNNSMPSFVGWDPSSLSLSQPSRDHGSTAKIEDWPLPHHQFLVYQPGMMSTTQSYVPSNIDHFNLKQPNFHSSNSSTSQPHVRPIHFGMTANLRPSQNENEQNKGDEFN